MQERTALRDQSTPPFNVQLRKLRPREGEMLVQGYITDYWQHPALELGPSDSQAFSFNSRRKLGAI
jgi:hypothetical protein